MKAVSSPRHADALVISGPVTRPTVEFVKSVYEATPEPKIVIALGSCATAGGIWFDSYNVVGGVDKIIPVNLYIPGCPLVQKQFSSELLKLSEYLKRK